MYYTEYVATMKWNTIYCVNKEIHILNRHLSAFIFLINKQGNNVFVPFFLKGFMIELTL